MSTIPRLTWSLRPVETLGLKSSLAKFNATRNDYLAEIVLKVFADDDTNVKEHILKLLKGFH